ncbi:coiled-coil domain-containing protein 138 isoform X5 [Papio anubis]|uniref:coiled-coil domain-containing protein 138 isoform X5 n=2 Tax=Cercopithecinae TaxID=9528 RepID=UPI0012AE8372|nr:coiled-coil domain-containing protein 138 isoform X5 [Papio anubis]
MQYYSSYEVCSHSTRDLEDAGSSLAAFSGFSSSAPPLPCGPACLWGRGLARRDAPRPRCAAGLMNAVPGETAAVAAYYGAEGRQASGAGFSSGASQKPLRTRGQLPGRGDLDIYSGDKVGSSLKYSDESKHCRTPLCSLFKRVNVNCLDDELDSFHDLKKQETEELIENDYRVSTSKITKQSFKEIEKVALPTNTTSSRPQTECCSDAGDSPLKLVSYPKSKASDKRSLLPRQISQIYDELFQIHLKLQCETAAQQKFAEELQKRESFLLEREQLLFRHENALSKIKGVEEEVLTRFQIMKEQHDAEVEHLTEVLKEKNKETKRLRSSFDALKELNDTLKKQLNEASEENRKMDIQAKRVQARLDNLQRKYEFMTIQRLKGSSHAVHEMKSLKQEKAPVSKTYKVPLNGQVYELLTVFMDWISDHHLSKVKHEESGMDGKKPQLKFASQRNDIQEKCVKLLPLMTEQLQWMPFVNTKLHEPFVKFIYWSLRQLDAGAQHSTMTSTLRRLGEDIFKGVVTKGIQDSSPQHSVENKPKTAAFFKSSNLPLRFLSTLIVLKTVTQADYLAQAFDSLCLDLKTEEGKTLFLEYQAVPVILSHLRISSKGLLSNVIDSLLQMTVESKSLQPFLEACSNSSFFRTCSVLLRAPKLDLQILEKLSIILQKLSKIKSNKKLFELFTIHLMLQEIQRTTNPEHAFLCINLNSTLFNLGLTKCNSLVSSASH